jgi:hypothetical protein
MGHRHGTVICLVSLTTSLTTLNLASREPPLRPAPLACTLALPRVEFAHDVERQPLYLRGSVHKGGHGRLTLSACPLSRSLYSRHLASRTSASTGCARHLVSEPRDAIFDAFPRQRVAGSCVHEMEAAMRTAGVARCVYIVREGMLTGSSSGERASPSHRGAACRGARGGDVAGGSRRCDAPMCHGLSTILSSSSTCHPKHCTAA